MLLWIVCCVAFASLGGCDPGQGPLRVRKILVDVEPEAQHLDREQVRAVVEGAVRRMRGIRVLEDALAEGAVLRVRVDGFDVTVDEAQTPRTSLALAVEVTGLATEGVGGLRGKAVSSGAGVIETRPLIEQALRDALAQVLLTRAASDLDSAELIGWLDNADASIEQKRRAARVLGSRRESRAVEALGRMLLADEAELKPLALNALSNIGDPSGVDAVITYADRQSAAVMKQCIDAVRSMGSRRGKAWLFTLSSGHPDDDIQGHAAAALASIESKEAESASTSAQRTVADPVSGRPD